MTKRYILGKTRGLLRLLRDRAAYLPFVVLTSIIPRSPRRWVFGSWYGGRFTGNPKHLYLYCHRNPAAAGVEAVWLSKSPAIVASVRALGLPAYRSSSLAGVWHALRAGVHIVDCRRKDTHAMAGRGALVVNVWHGVPLKKIERDIDQPDHTVWRAHYGPWWTRLLLKFRRPELTERYDVVLATADEVADRFAAAFGTPRSDVLVCGYPRTDELITPTNQRLLLADERPVVSELAAHRAAGTRVLFYMPTFRDAGNTPDRRIPIDWDALHETLVAHNGMFYCKLHPGDRANLPRVDHLSRIRLLPAEIDPVPLLAYTDALISDYSSIAFDYLLLDRPIVYYAYDLPAYLTESRGMYDPFHTVVAGPVVTNTVDLTAEVSSLLTAYEATSVRHADARARVRGRFYAHVDDQAAPRLVAALWARLAR